MDSFVDETSISERRMIVELTRGLDPSLVMQLDCPATARALSPDRRGYVPLR